MLFGLALGSCGDDRPTDAGWAVDWERERSRVPSADELLEGGQAICDELIGEFGANFSQLQPSSTEALDDAVTSWIGHAESLVVDCPDDAAELAERRRVLDVLAAEVDAGLAAEG